MRAEFSCEISLRKVRLEDEQRNDNIKTVSLLRSQELHYKKPVLGSILSQLNPPRNAIFIEDYFSRNYAPVLQEALPPMRAHIPPF
jgi:hypothetical protein